MNKKYIFMLLSIVFLFFCTIAIADENELRMWKSKQGTILTARLLNDDGTSVILKDVRGSKMLIKRNFLSDEDIKYLNALRSEENFKQQAIKFQEQEEYLKNLFIPTGMSVEEFHATKPKHAVVFKAIIKLDDYYNYEFGNLQNSLWSINVENVDGKYIGHGYISKEGKGEELFNIIREGKKYAFIVRIRYSEYERGGNVFYLDDYLRISPDQLLTK